MLGGVALGLAASACVVDRSTLSPAGPAARRLADLGWPVLLFFLATCVVLWLLLLWLALRRRGSLDEHAPAGEGGGIGWILVGGIAIPALSFGVVFVMTLDTMAAFPVHAGHHAPEVRVIGHQWWWEVQYLGGSLPDRVTTANEIHLPVGRPVEIELLSYDVIHSLWVPRLHGKVDLVPGHVNHVVLQADAPGIYPGACAELCGKQHANMRLLVVADQPEAFERWLAGQRAVAREPGTAEQTRGRDVFQQAACPLCHTVRGTRALATVGPDLTHLASRRTLGSASLPNDVATLHAWVVDAPSLKPGVRMPALHEFTGPQLHDLVAYLRSLE